jgi:hypothetical protein
VAHLGVQVHGGMGFIEETGAAQFSRDVRVTKIYEGTNGIHAMDLVGRKLSVDNGAMARSMVAEIAATGGELATAGAEFAALAAEVVAAAEAAASATEWMLAAPGFNDRGLAMARFFATQIAPQTTALAKAATQGAAPLYALDAETLTA